MARSVNMANLYDPERRPTPPAPDPGYGGGADTGAPAGDVAGPTGGRAPLYNVDQQGDGTGGGGTAPTDPAPGSGGTPADPNYDPYHGLGESGGAFTWNIANDPGYQFRLAEQQRQLNSDLARRGDYFSGNALKEGLRLSGGMASDEAAAAYNRERGIYDTNTNERQRLFGNYTSEDQRRWEDQFRGNQQQWANDFAGQNAGFANWLNLANLGMNATGQNTGQQQHTGDQNNQSFLDLINAYLASLQGGGATTGSH